MKRFIILITLISAPLFASAQTNFGVSIDIGQPGYYGQIQIGNVAPPVLYAQPTIIQPMPVGVSYQPLYLHVPTEHYRNWRYYCGRYNACGQPVYFVSDSWYRNNYAPSYRHDQHYYREDEHRYNERHYEQEHAQYRDERHDERRDERRDDYREERHHEHRDGGRDER